jgi:hypothetical protein
VSHVSHYVRIWRAEMCRLLLTGNLLARLTSIEHLDTERLLVSYGVPRNYSPNSKIVVANSALSELILADLFSCHPLVGGVFFW